MLQHVAVRHVVGRVQSHVEGGPHRLDRRLHCGGESDDVERDFACPLLQAIGRYDFVDQTDLVGPLGADAPFLVISASCMTIDSGIRRSNTAASSANTLPTARCVSISSACSAAMIKSESAT